MHIFNNLGEAWLYGLREIMNHGELVLDDSVRVRDVSLKGLTSNLSNFTSNNKDLKLRLKEIRGYNIKIYNISRNDDIINKYADADRILYTIKRYGNDCGENGYGEFLRGKNNEKVKSIIDKLQHNKNSKSAIIISPSEWGGNFGKSPCLTAVNFLVRNNKLLMYVFYRSQNIYTKQPGNLLALDQLHEEIAKSISVDKGPMELYVCSAHIYECDFEKVSIILESERGALEDERKKDRENL